MISAKRMIEKIKNDQRVKNGLCVLYYYDEETQKKLKVKFEDVTIRGTELYIGEKHIPSDSLRLMKNKGRVIWKLKLYS